MRKLKLENLKASVGRSDYDVDAEAVAEAIVRRLTGARRGAGWVPGGRSGEVLEAG